MKMNFSGKQWKIALSIPFLCMLLLLGTACGSTAASGVGGTRSDPAPAVQTAGGSDLQLLEKEDAQGDPGGPQDAQGDPGGQQGIQTSGGQDAEDSSGGQKDAQISGSGQEKPDENGTYTTKEDVALYLHVYGRLPKNFITKEEAGALGWSGGSLEKYAPGMCIGGNRFGNREGRLPKGKYRECDINTLGKKNRGAERLIYSDDGRIYYTGDHYEHFTLLYGKE